MVALPAPPCRETVDTISCILRREALASDPPRSLPLGYGAFLRSSSPRPPIAGSRRQTSRSGNSGFHRARTALKPSFARSDSGLSRVGAAPSGEGRGERPSSLSWPPPRQAVVTYSGGSIRYPAERPVSRPGILELVSHISLPKHRRVGAPESRSWVDS